MLKLKWFITLPVLFILFAGVPIQAEVFVGESSSSPSASRNASQAASQKKIMKFVGVVKKIEKNTLYMQSGKKYKLNGVKVEYAKGKPLSRNKKMAEMYFVNGILKEVTIR
ncbi:MAG: hypothetical protein K4571_07040 [Deltaproteobacteria bacterium]